MTVRVCFRLFTRCRVLAALTAALLLLAGAAQADTPANEEEDSTKLAEETQNPVANLISVPFQSNFNFDTGTKNATVWILNVQPVIPIPISEHLNLITRTIMPIINQPPLFSVGRTANVATIAARSAVCLRSERTLRSVRPGCIMAHLVSMSA
jgi:hypothetical protein